MPEKCSREVAGKKNKTKDNTTHQINRDRHKEQINKVCLPEKGGSFYAHDGRKKNKLASTMQ